MTYSHMERLRYNTINNLSLNPDKIQFKPSLNWTCWVFEKTVEMWHSLGLGIWATGSIWKDQDCTDYTSSLDILWQGQGSHHTDWYIKDWTWFSLTPGGATHSLCLKNIDWDWAKIFQHCGRTIRCHFWTWETASLYIWELYHSCNRLSAPHNHMEGQLQHLQVNNFYAVLILWLCRTPSHGITY